MLEARLAAHMREAADNVLATMFLSPLVENPQEQVSRWNDPIIVGLEFRGRHSHGKCALVTEESTARALSATFLCEDGEMSRHSAWEVMCELSNMFCGRFLGQMDAQESYSLSPPTSLVPGDIGLMHPLHKSSLCTAHGIVLFLVELEADTPLLRKLDE